MITLDMKRLTVSMPEDIYNRMMERVSPGEVSSYISGAVENSLTSAPKPIPLENIMDEIYAFRASLKKTEHMTVDEIIATRDEGRV
jgi:hypothetical protein